MVYELILTNPGVVNGKGGVECEVGLRIRKPISTGWLWRVSWSQEVESVTYVNGSFITLYLSEIIQKNGEQFTKSLQ